MIVQRVLVRRVWPRNSLAEACSTTCCSTLLCSYAVPHVPWRRLAEAPPRLGRDWGELVARLLGLTYAMSELTLPVLSKPQVGGVAVGGCG